MSVSVERLDKDKDADEIVYADHVRTKRPVGSEQSIDLFTQREEIDNFRVSELTHAVVKHARVDLQQSNVHNPFAEKSKKMIRDMDNVELFELYETIPKV